MDKKYLIKEYNSMLYEDKKINRLLKEYITRSCLNIANKANFPTDYNDVESHLFGDERYIKLFIVEETENVIPDIKGFLVCDTFYGYKGMIFLHCHGIVLSPEIQGLGLSKTIINYAIKLTNPDVVTAKTHNPRCFNSFINLDGVISYYPNESGIIPKQIINLSKTNKFISKSDDDLIYRDAYPDEKIQQTKRNEKINSIFDKLSPYDAQSLIVILNDEKLKAKKKVLKYDNK